MSKAFSVFLQDLQDGRTHSEMSAKLTELIEAVRATGRGGEITLVIKVKPATRGDVDKVTITDDVRLKLPAPDRKTDIFWLTDAGELSRNHPRQGDLDLKTVAKPALGDLKEASK
mgnify:CR=1 FL=1